MTYPAQPAAAPATSTSQQDEDQLIILLATALLTATAASAVLATILPRLRSLPIPIPPSPMLMVLHLVMSMQHEQTGAAGPASMAVIRLNSLRRAQFAVAAGHRVTSDLLSARSRGETASSVLARSIARERRYYGAHLEANWQRATAAIRVDQASWAYGDVLGWNAVHDAHTSAECRAADGKNFLAAVMPAIGWPGSVHPHCRCYPGPAHIGARMLPSTYEPVRIPVMTA